jgi:hypothetical protein
VLKPPSPAAWISRSPSNNCLKIKSLQISGDFFAGYAGTVMKILHFSSSFELYQQRIKNTRLGELNHGAGELG